MLSENFILPYREGGIMRISRERERREFYSLVAIQSMSRLSRQIKENWILFYEVLKEVLNGRT